MVNAQSKICNFCGREMDGTIVIQYKCSVLDCKDCTRYICQGRVHDMGTPQEKAAKKKELNTPEKKEEWKLDMLAWNEANPRYNRKKNAPDDETDGIDDQIKRRRTSRISGKMIFGYFASNADFNKNFPDEKGAPRHKQYVYKKVAGVLFDAESVPLIRNALLPPWIRELTHEDNDEMEREIEIATRRKLGSTSAMNKVWDQSSNVLAPKVAKKRIQLHSDKPEGVSVTKVAFPNAVGLDGDEDEEEEMPSMLRFAMDDLLLHKRAWGHEDKNDMADGDSICTPVSKKKKKSESSQLSLGDESSVKTSAPSAAADEEDQKENNIVAEAGETNACTAVQETREVLRDVTMQLARLEGSDRADIQKLDVDVFKKYSKQIEDRSGEDLMALYLDDSVSSTAGMQLCSDLTKTRERLNSAVELLVALVEDSVMDTSDLIKLAVDYCNKAGLSAQLGVFHTCRFEVIMGKLLSSCQHEIVIEKALSTQEEQSYTIARVLLDEKPALQRKWVSKVMIVTLMGNSYAQLVKMIEVFFSFPAPDDQWLRESMTKLREACTCDDVGDPEILKELQSHCKSVNFMFQVPFKDGATGRIVQGKIESRRLVLMERNEAKQCCLVMHVPNSVCLSKLDGVFLLVLPNAKEWLCLRNKMAQMRSTVGVLWLASLDCWRSLCYKLRAAMLAMISCSYHNYVANLESAARSIVVLYTESVATEAVDSRMDHIKASLAGSMPEPESLGLVNLSLSPEEDEDIKQYMQCKSSCDRFAEVILQMCHSVLNGDLAAFDLSILASFRDWFKAPPQELSFHGRTSLFAFKYQTVERISMKVIDDIEGRLKPVAVEFKKFVAAVNNKTVCDLSVPAAIKELTAMDDGKVEKIVAIFFEFCLPMSERTRAISITNGETSELSCPVIACVALDLWKILLECDSSSPNHQERCRVLKYGEAEVSKLSSRMKTFQVIIGSEYQESCVKIMDSLDALQKRLQAQLAKTAEEAYNALQSWRKESSALAKSFTHFLSPIVLDEGFLGQIRELFKAKKVDAFTTSHRTFLSCLGTYSSVKQITGAMCPELDAEFEGDKQKMKAVYHQLMVLQVLCSESKVGKDGVDKNACQCYRLVDLSSFQASDASRLILKGLTDRISSEQRMSIDAAKLSKLAAKPDA